MHNHSLRIHSVSTHSTFGDRARSFNLVGALTSHLAHRSSTVSLGRLVRTDDLGPPSSSGGPAPRLTSQVLHRHSNNGCRERFPTGASFSARSACLAR